MSEQWTVATARFQSACPTCSRRIRPGKDRIAYIQGRTGATVCASCYESATMVVDGPGTESWDAEFRERMKAQRDDYAAKIAAVVASSSPREQRRQPSREPADVRAWERAWRDPQTGDDPAEREDRGDYRHWKGRR